MSLIEELQRDALDPSTKVADLLRKARLVAAKLGVREAVEWMEHELSGYPPDAVIPNYRELRGQPVYMHPYFGWVPLAFGRPETHETLSRRKSRQAISEIQDILDRSEKSGGAQISYPRALVADLARQFSLEIPAAGLSVSLNSLAGILDEVRTRVLDWAMKLEAAGIRGEGLSFTHREQEQASTVNFNIGSIGSMVGTVGPIGGQATVSVTGQVTKEQIEMLLSLARQVQKLADKMDLPEEATKRILEDARELEAETQRSLPEPGKIRALLDSMKSVAVNAVGNLVSSGVIEMIQRVGL